MRFDALVPPALNLKSAMLADFPERPRGKTADMTRSRETFAPAFSRPLAISDGFSSAFEPKRHKAKEEHEAGIPVPNVWNAEENYAVRSRYPAQFAQGFFCSSLSNDWLSLVVQHDACHRRHVIVREEHKPLFRNGALIEPLALGD